MKPEFPSGEFKESHREILEKAKNVRDIIKQIFSWHLDLLNKKIRLIANQQKVNWPRMLL